MQTICNYFATLVQSVSLSLRLSKKLNLSISDKTESGSKQRLSLFQEKVVIQAFVPEDSRQLVYNFGFRPKGRAKVFRKI